MPHQVVKASFTGPPGIWQRSPQSCSSCHANAGPKINILSISGGEEVIPVSAMARGIGVISMILEFRTPDDHGEVIRGSRSVAGS